MRIYRRCGDSCHGDSAAPADVAVDAGMSLVEVLVAISIVTIGVLGLLAALVSDVKSQTLEKSQATALVSGLAWRGIRGYPLTDDH